MLVKALRMGYYGNQRRRPDEVFEIQGEHEVEVTDKEGNKTKKKVNDFSSKWMEEVDDVPVQPKKRTEEGGRRPAKKDEEVI